MNKKISFLIIACLSAMLVSCAQNVSPNTYGASEVGVTSKVIPGVIVSKREVDIDAHTSAGGAAGAAAGAAAGGVAGATMGSSLSTGLIGAIGGAVVGGVAGNAIDKAVNHHKGYEYIIKLKDGSTVSVAQAHDVQLAVKQHVLVIYGAMTRVVPDTTAG